MDIKKNFSAKLGVIIFFLSFFSLIFSFFLNEDGSGRGASGDFDLTYSFVLALQDNIFTDPKDHDLVHTPLHFIILSNVAKIVEDPNNLRLLFCIFAIILPVFFYKALATNKKDQNLNSLIILSSCIFFLPAFRYTSIWANGLITSSIFFIISIFFFKKWELNQSKKIDFNIFLQFIFLVLAVYSRQYFAVFFADVHENIQIRAVFFKIFNEKYSFFADFIENFTICFAFLQIFMKRCDFCSFFCRFQSKFNDFCSFFC